MSEDSKKNETGDQAENKNQQPGPKIETFELNIMDAARLARVNSLLKDAQDQWNVLVKAIVPDYITQHKEKKVEILEIDIVKKSITIRINE